MKNGSQIIYRILALEEPTTSIHISPYPQVRARLDDLFITMQNLSREQPYGMPNSKMASLHNNASTFANH